jgi:hypothetical protein
MYHIFEKQQICLFRDVTIAENVKIFLPEGLNNKFKTTIYIT